MVGPNDGFFKNNVGRSDAPRTYSPGFFSLIVISPANQVTPLEVQLEWDVTLRNPTLNPLVDEGPLVTTSLTNFGVQGSDTPDTPYVSSLKSFIDGVESDLKPDDFSPALRPNVYYFLSGGQLTITGNTGGSGAPQAVIATHIGLAADGANVYLHRYVVSNETFEVIGLLNIQSQPLASAAPTFRQNAEFRADPLSPGLSNSTSLLGFQQLSLLPSILAKSRSARSRQG